MDHPDQLQPEDLPVFERTLDRALNSSAIQTERARTTGAFNNEQLRTLALGARAGIATEAMDEYRVYRRLLASPAGRTRRFRRSPGGPVDATGGPLPALAVLVPALSTVAAAVFAVIGFGLRAVGAGSRLSEGMLVAALAAGCVAAVTVLAGAVWLLATAIRNRSTVGDTHPAVTHARDAWEQALLERGILPFLRAALQSATVKDATAVRPTLTATTPAVGGTAGARTPRAGRGFSAPDFSSPDFTAPELPETD